MKKLLLFSIVFFLLMSCARYRFGVSLPKEYRAIGVGEVVNLTSESRLASMLRNSLVESVMNTPGITSVPPESAHGLRLSARIVELDQQRGARARLREPRDRDVSGKTYQTVVFRMTVKVEYQAIVVADNTLYRGGEVTVTSDFPTMADQETARSAALREAMRSAAQQIVAAVAEE